MSIVICNYEVISPLGYGAQENWRNLFIKDYSPNYKLNISEFQIADFLWETVACEFRDVVPERVAVVLSNSKYNFSAFGDETRFVNTFLPHNLSSYVAAKIGNGCIPYSVSGACATGIMSVMKGVEILNRGIADVVLAGSIEASIVPLMQASFQQLGVLSKRRQTLPFDRQREGFVIGEGGAMFVLKKACEAVNYPKIAGYSYLNDAYDLVAFNPNTQSIERAIKLATSDISNIGYVNAHGTATKINDALELKALTTVYGQTDKRPYVSSTKGHTGHLLGATGSVELALTLLSLQHQQVIPHKELSNPMPEIVPFIENSPTFIESALTLNYGFGGHVAALAISR